MTSEEFGASGESESTAEAAGDASSAGPGGTQQTVLFVDDQDAIRRVARLSLEMLGYRVITASSGREAIERLNEGLKVDAVILDLSMPSMSGQEACQRIKDQTPNVAVIAMSGDQAKLDEFRLNRLHRPDGVLAKPFRIPDLKSVLDDSVGGNSGG